MTDSILTKLQYKNYGPKPIAGYAKGAAIWALVRYDDSCNNGHNTFSITAHVTEPGKKDWASCRCLHQEIAKAFPELVPLIKWHLCSSDGPMHYVANTVCHASDRDHNGLLKDEKRQLRNGKTGMPVWERIARNEAGERVKIGHADWVDSAEKPVEELKIDWEPVWRIGEGKARELDYARSSAIWPDATDEDLTTPGLKERLEARLPALMAEFREAVESLGFTF